MDTINLANLPDLAESLGLGNEALGALLWALAVREQARDLSVPLDAVPFPLAEIVTTHLLTLEADTAGLAAIEKALHKAGCGDFSGAGQFLREVLTGGAVVERFLPAGMNRIVQAKDFGSRGAEENREVGRLNRERVCNTAREILAGWQSSKLPTGNALAERVAKKTGLAVSTVKSHLTKLKRGGFLD